MSEPSNKEQETPKKNKYKEVTGYVLVGCILTGMGISFATGTMPVGLFIGLGIGFLLMALIRHKKSD